MRLINMQSVQVFFVAVCRILNYLRTMKPHKLVCLLFVSLNSEKSLKNRIINIVFLKRSLSFSVDLWSCLQLVLNLQNQRSITDYALIMILLIEHKKEFQLFNLGSINFEVCYKYSNVDIFMNGLIVFFWMCISFPTQKRAIFVWYSFKAEFNRRHFGFKTQTLIVNWLEVF